MRQSRFTILDGPLMRNPSKLARTIIVAASLAIALAATSLFVARRSFNWESGDHQGSMRGWKPIGGRWSEHSGIISNRNYGRGDMLIAQHSKGKNYRISADVRFDLLLPETEYGDAGLVIRTTDPQLGVDSYQGYYAGIRPNLQTIVLGRASYDWHQLCSVPLATPIRVGSWYHLELAVIGCSLTVTATPQGDRPPTRVEYTDDHCLTEGVAGLRSFYTQASWRNVQIIRN
jgi:3-keto-disaccharide hydrolase